MVPAMSLAGRVAIVTGGGRGIGQAISLALAEDGADIAINYRRAKDDAAETAEAVRKHGRRAEIYAAAVDDYDATAAMVEAVIADFGRIDILVHNAGIASRGLTVENTDPAELERVVRVHAFGPHVLSKWAIPHLRNQERGDIVMVSSMATKQYGAGGAPYNMGKAAMEGLAFTLSKEVRHENIRVNVVAPGLVETEMGRRLMKGVAGIDDLRKLDRTSPFGRVCQPEDVANVVRFIVSDRNTYLTGEKINVYGGGTETFNPKR